MKMIGKKSYQGAVVRGQWAVVSCQGAVFSYQWLWIIASSFSAE